MDLSRVFMSIASMVSTTLGAPFYTGRVVDPGAAVYDDGGSILIPAAPSFRACMVEIASATDSMRQAEGFTDGDVRFVVLTASLTGTLGTDATVEVTGGPFAGAWSVSSIERDPANIGYVGRGRRITPNPGA